MSTFWWCRVTILWIYPGKSNNKFSGHTSGHPPNKNSGHKVFVTAKISGHRPKKELREWCSLIAPVERLDQEIAGMLDSRVHGTRIHVEKAHAYRETEIFEYIQKYA